MLVASKAVRPLAEHHRRTLEVESAIRADVIDERGYRTAYHWQELDGLGFRGTQKRPECFPALVVPQWAPNGECPYSAVRWDNPRVTLGGRVIRYDMPAGTALRLDVPPRCRPGLLDTEQVMWITEGSKKADALASRDAIAVSLPGVWTWKTASVMADLDSIAWRDRRVILVFDDDALTKRQVRNALLRLAAWLLNRRADVRIVDWARLPGVAA
jgi:hypothetical protein